MTSLRGLRKLIMPEGYCVVTDLYNSQMIQLVFGSPELSLKSCIYFTDEEVADKVINELTLKYNKAVDRLGDANLINVVPKLDLTKDYIAVNFDDFIQANIPPSQTFIKEAVILGEFDSKELTKIKFSYSKDYSDDFMTSGYNRDIVNKILGTLELEVIPTYEMRMASAYSSTPGRYIDKAEEDTLAFVYKSACKHIADLIKKGVMASDFSDIFAEYPDFQNCIRDAVQEAVSIDYCTLKKIKCLTKFQFKMGELGETKVPEDFPRAVIKHHRDSEMTLRKLKIDYVLGRGKRRVFFVEHDNESLSSTWNAALRIHNTNDIYDHVCGVAFSKLKHAEKFCNDINLCIEVLYAEMERLRAEGNHVTISGGAEYDAMSNVKEANKRITKHSISLSTGSQVSQKSIDVKFNTAEAITLNKYCITDSDVIRHYSTAVNYAFLDHRTKSYIQVDDIDVVAAEYNYTSKYVETLNILLCTSFCSALDIDYPESYNGAVIVWQGLSMSWKYFVSSVITNEIEQQLIDHIRLSYAKYKSNG